jgi:predicted ATPase
MERFDDRLKRTPRLLLEQAQVVVVLKGPGAVEQGHIAAEAIRVSEPLGDDLLHFRARWADWNFRSLSGDLPAAAERADQLVGMAERVGTSEMQLQARHARWTTAFLRGQVAVTRDDVEHGLALYDFEQHRRHLAMYAAHDPGICARGTGACALWQAGLASRAETCPMRRSVLVANSGILSVRQLPYGTSASSRSWSETPNVREPAPRR